MKTILFSIAILTTTLTFGQSTCDSLDVQFNSELSLLNCQSIADFTDSSRASKIDRAIAWEWDFSDGTRRSILQNPIHNYTSGGVHDVKLKVKTDSGCIDSSTNKIFIPGPQPGFGFRDWTIGLEDTAHICQGDFIEIINFSRGDVSDPLFELNWSDGNTSTDIPIGDTFSHLYNTPGIYELFLTQEDEIPRTGTRCFRIFPDTNANLINPRNIVVIVHPKPSASITVGTSPTYAGHPTSFTANLDPNYTRIKWMMGDGTTYTEPDASNNSIIHKFQSIGIYDVILAPEYDELPRCWERDTFELEVLDASLNSVVEPSIRLKTFPNPASDKVHIESKEGENIRVVELSDILGKSYTPIISRSGIKTTRDVSGLATGTYELKVATNGGTTIKKIKIERE